MAERSEALELAKAVLRGECSTFGDEVPMARALVSYAVENERLREIADWVRQYQRECEAGGAARDPMLRASVRQSMFDAAESLLAEAGS